MKYYLKDTTYNVYLTEKIYKPLKESVAQHEDIELDSAVLIIHNIINRKFQDKNYEDGSEYVTMYSKVLEKYVRNYKKYIEFLKKENFIHYVDSYHKGKSREFKVVDKYFDLENNLTISQSGIVAHIMEDSLINKNRRDFDIARKNEAETRNPELTKWLDSKGNKFSILYDEAIAYVNENYSVILDSSGNDINKYKRIKRLLTIEKLNNGSILFSREGKDDRFHSNFTSISSDIKQFIYYENKPIKEIDIKSSQPVMISILFEKIMDVVERCYNMLPSKGSRTQQDINIFRGELSKGLRKSIYELTTKKYLNNVIDTKEYIKAITIMFTEYFKTLDNTQFSAFKTDIENFIKLVRTGTYYEVLGKQLLDGNIIQEVLDITTGELKYQVLKYNKRKKRNEFTKPDTLRNTAKSVILNVIYMPAHEKRNKAINYFRANNPSISCLLRILMLDTKKWSDSNHSKFPILIQQIESKFILDYCVKKIAKKHPKMLLLTIHDSISTTLDYFDTLELEFKQLFKDYFEFDVKTGDKCWNKNLSNTVYKASA